jgi:serine/threonine protein kinase
LEHAWLIALPSFPLSLAGHGKPVDIWAIGVITYFLLCGYTPFDHDTQKEEMEAIISRNFKFEPGT